MIDIREGALMDYIERIAGAMDGLKQRGPSEAAEQLAQTIFDARAFVRHVRESEGAPDDMPAGWNRPAPASNDAVCGALHDALEAVEIGDSFEGFVMWTMPTDEPELQGADFGLMARYRVGNLQGQGGLRVFTGEDEPST